MHTLVLWWLVIIDARRMDSATTTAALAQARGEIVQPAPAPLKSKMLHQEADLVEQIVRSMKPVFEAQLAEMHKLAKTQPPP